MLFGLLRMDATGDHTHTHTTKKFSYSLFVPSSNSFIQDKVLQFGLEKKGSAFVVIYMLSINVTAICLFLLLHNVKYVMQQAREMCLKK